MINLALHLFLIIANLVIYVRRWTYYVVISIIDLIMNERLKSSNMSFYQTSKYLLFIKCEIVLSFGNLLFIGVCHHFKISKLIAK